MLAGTVSEEELELLRAHAPFLLQNLSEPSEKE
jgi:hypothetical protein